ncbi:AraC family transcriptional regulator [Mucilaginibacter sp. SP1R1]|uniref:AraC family transcriptional regulator n=1 Tax=Mucilaginibacter sp. SP1R1 TaxID=2723091 RepID=UPI00160EAEBC|nr:AraC family transcriptional regulator [Mucilaginibacter sp. SP1R1]MBB6147955.1 AraC-like DNA-binding protein [Mucilaginibacter sp. SP1R1]
MHIRNLTQKLDIDFVIKNEWHLPVHKHTHFELQYIIRGKGQHIVNGCSYNYQKGDLFILAPNDNHFFIFQEKCTICIIKFHEGFFHDFLMDEDFKQVFTRISSSYHKTALTGNGKQQVGQLMDLIIAENKRKGSYQHIIIKNALSLILSLMANDADQNAVTPRDQKIQAILNYIDEHIIQKHLLATQIIADNFHISKTYFNQYFSKATGSSYKKYVQEYALKLIAHQLIHHDKTLSQLANEFGYTDESHLSNAFKAHFHQTPSVFKKEKHQR